MLDSYLNIRGESELLEACRGCFASLFTDRAIGYREKMGYGHLDVSLCVGVQRMVRSDKAGAGVMFSIDKDTGFPDLVVITAAWGLGESVVQGTVIPDEYRVYKLPAGENTQTADPGENFRRQREEMRLQGGRRNKRCAYHKGRATEFRTAGFGDSDPREMGHRHRNPLRPAHGY